ncbi:peptide ABC transporter substrate-binding protein [Blastopirellula marina]|uniref:Peptide ABC transporter substrate-binding protein n=1 Tax=Blastopirellula marina TaxID=124 RepID=A0A2S8FUF2_9BACT|nr:MULTISPECIES: ABC transporter substrate-binding protein [Pirellulaceae]PQO35811.1 peptide ABC transporter substrate-binding protein [Blastopirellula marina]RCS53386.1 peptide ABC transporter substrate-binding protein [Bremerella cremea]
MTNIRGALGIHLFLFLAILAPLAGCTGGSSDLSPEELEQAIKDFNFDEGLPFPEFVPPATLEELDSSITWTDKPVVAPLPHLRQEMADYKPPVTPQEALEIRPKSDEDYERILAAMEVQPSDETPADMNATWVHHEGGDVNSLNPLRMSSVGDFFYVYLTSAQAVTSNIDIESIGDGRFIKSWQSNEDNTIQKVVLRDDIVWSDGQPITAHDWEFTFKVLHHPKLLTMFPALPSSLEHVKLIKAYDDRTFVVFHELSSPVNDMKLEFPIVPKHAYEPAIAEDPSLTDSNFFLEQEQTPIVGGPYKVTQRDRNQRIALERREDFYMHNGKEVREKPYFAKIRIEIIENPTQALLALTAGKLDDSEISATKWDTEANTDEFFEKNIKVKTSSWSEGHITWNIGTPYFDDARTRRAMSYAIDYDAIINGVLKGIHPQASGPFHPDAWFSPDPSLPLFTQDLEKARELLEEAGWKDTDADGILDKKVDGKKVSFAFQLMHPPSPVSELMAAQFARDFGKLGIKCEPRQYEWTVMQDKARQHTFDALMAGWGSGGDPFSNVNIYGTGSSRNYGQYSNKKVDELFDLGLRELDHEKRTKHYQEIAKILYEDQPYTWIYYRAELYGFNKNMRGYRFSPTGPWFYQPGSSSVWKAKAQ